MDLNNIYTELILEQSKNKRNRRNLENPTHEELGHNPSCGDEISLQVRIKNDQIEDISYTGHGCAISQASTSIMIDEVRGMNLSQAKILCDKFIGMVKGEISDEAELEDLGDAVAFENIQNLPARVKCAVLAWYTLKNIIEKDETSANISSK